MSCCGGIDTAKQKRDNQRQAGVVVNATPPSQYTVDLTASDNTNMQRAMEVIRSKYHKRHLNG